MAPITQDLRIAVEDPFAPQFESISALTERIKRASKLILARSR